MEKITEILQEYAISPQAIVPVTERVHKIKANGKEFALKRSRLDRNTLNRWLATYRTASELGLSEIIPVYLTVRKRLYVKREDEYYYLTPWIEKNKRPYGKKTVENVYRHIGNIHVRTKKLTTLETNRWIDPFDSYKKYCEEKERRLTTWMERLEQKHYPSPVELQILTHYQNVRTSLRRSGQLTEEILSLSESDTGWGVCLNHGNLEQGHFFERYIINWEKASYQHPVHDLTGMLHHEAVHAPQLTEDYIQSFSAYLDEHPLNPLERTLLVLYLMNSTEYLRMVEVYVLSRVRDESEIEWSMKLEQNYRKVITGLMFDAFNREYKQASELD